MNKNLLFIGASGRLGRKWINKLDQNYSVFALVNKNKFKTYHKKIKLRLLNKRKLNTFCKNNSIGIIINCCALTMLEKCQKFKKSAYIKNTLIPEILADVSKKNAIKLVHISTDHLFDGMKKNYSEKSKLNPLNYYAKTKMMGEKKIINKLKNYIIIRTNFFSFSKRKDTFLEKSLEKLKKNKEVKAWDNVKFTPIHTDTLIKIANLLIKKDFKGLINVSSNESISKYEFLFMVAKHLKIDTNNIKKEKLKNNIFKIKRPLNMSLSNLILKKILRSLKILKIKKQIETLKNV